MLIAGCGGGGGSTGVIPNNGSVTTIDPTATPGTLVEVPNNPTTTPGSTIPSNLPTGTFKVEVQFPGSGSGVRAKDLAGSDLPYNSHTLRVTITGEAISTSITGERNDLDPTGAGTYTLTVSNVPVGLNTATIEVLAPSGNLLCHRKHGFYMTPGATEGPSLIQLGIAIGPDGSCNPQEIDIPAGTDLLFQNQDYDNDRQIWLNGLTLGIGPIAHAEHITQPVTAEVFHTESHLFDMAGTYNYDPGYGGPGRILVYGLPVLTGIANNSDPSNDYSAVNFTLTGDNFGLSRDSVNGDIRFIQVNEGDPNNPWGSSFGGAFINEWTDDYITGTIELSPGKYRIEVTVRGENTTEQVIFYKGTGNYEIIVGDPNSNQTPTPTPTFTPNIPPSHSVGANVRVNDGGSHEWAVHPSTAVDSTGNFYAIWSSNNSNIYFSYKPSGGSWSENVKVNDALQGSGDFPSIAVDSNGNAYAIWQDSRNGNTDIYFSYRPSGGNWSSSTRVDDNINPNFSCELPGIAIDASGNAYVVWHDNRNGYNHIYYSYQTPGGNWSPSVRVDNSSANTVNCVWPRIASDPSGNLYITWHEDFIFNVYFSYRPSGGNWNPGIRVNDVPNVAGWGFAGADLSENAYVVWVDHRNTTGYNIYSSILNKL